MSRDELQSEANTYLSEDNHKAEAVNTADNEGYAKSNRGKEVLSG